MSDYPAPRSRLSYEFDQFVQNLRRVRDHFLNETFDLTLEGAQRRTRTMVITFILAILLVGFFTHPISDWINAIRNIFIWVLNPAAREQMGVHPFTDVITLATGSVSNLIRYSAIFLLAYWFAVHSASLYLADIFEQPVQLARNFITQVALGGTGEVARIENGQFKDKEKSRIYAIGGPGYVIVDRNSAALFEKRDGRPHVIGPTVGGRVLINGFERFRMAIDLRDQHIDLRDQTDNEIITRSQDGMPISAIDVSVRYSVWRGAEKTRTLRDPNPFKDDQVIEDLVYNQVRPVSKEPKDTAGEIPSPLGRQPVVALIRGEFTRFVSEHKLSEFLASPGVVEVRAAQEQARSVVERTQQVIPRGEPTPDLRVPSLVPDFVPRSDISARFNEGFAAQANRRGFQLDWLGVGTWRTPIGVVPDHHLEAWKLSLENAYRGSEEALQEVERDGRLYRTIQLVQNVPLAQFHDDHDNLSLTHQEAVKRLLISYMEQLIEARELMASKESERQRVAIAHINTAIDYIRELVGWQPGTSYHRPGRVIPEDGLPLA